jgi:acyl-CoA synthetase (AMP-forming)/AMP-acid ligase II
MTNFASIVFQNANARSEAVALVGTRTSLSYGELRHRIGRLANALRTLGVGKGDRVAVLLGNVPQYVEQYLAVAALGAIIVPINTRLTPEEQLVLLEDAAPTVLITSEAGIATARLAMLRLQACRRVLLLDGSLESAIGYEKVVAEASADFSPVPVDPDDTAVILYTSGTTSGAKGVMLTHGNLLSNMRQYQSFVGIPPGSVNLQLSPLYHAANIFCFVHLLVGGKTVFIDKISPAAILDVIQSHRVNFMFTVPTVLYGIIDCPGREGYDISSLQTLQYGAAAITGARLEAAFAVFGERLLHSYGLTETTSHASILGKHEHRIAMGSIGRPLPGVEMQIVNDRGERCGPNEVGEIVVRGPNIMKGYWKRPTETASALADGWLHTGDLGRVDERGFFFVVDRKKDLIISGGVNIYPRDIENVLAIHPAVAEVAVFGLPDDYWGEAVAAAVVLRPGQFVDAEALREFARSRLGGFKVPKVIRYMDALPKNAVGKILKRELRTSAGG